MQNNVSRFSFRVFRIRIKEDLSGLRHAVCGMRYEECGMRPSFAKASGGKAYG